MESPVGAVLLDFYHVPQEGGKDLTLSLGGLEIED